MTDRKPFPPPPSSNNQGFQGNELTTGPVETGPRDASGAHAARCVLDATVRSVACSTLFSVPLAANFAALVEPEAKD